MQASACTAVTGHGTSDPPSSGVCGAVLFGVSCSKAASSASVKGSAVIPVFSKKAATASESSAAWDADIHSAAADTDIISSATAAAAWGCMFPPDGGWSHRYQMNTSGLTPFSYHTNQDRLFQLSKNLSVFLKCPPFGGRFLCDFSAGALLSPGKSCGHAPDPACSGAPWQCRPPA